MLIVARNTFMAFFHLCIPVVLAVLLFWCVKAHQADKRSKWTWLWADGAAMQSTANHPGHMPDSSISASAKMKTVSTKKSNDPLHPCCLSSFTTLPQSSFPIFLPLSVDTNCLTVCCFSCRQPGYNHNTLGRRCARGDEMKARECMEWNSRVTER